MLEAPAKPTFSEICQLHTIPLDHLIADTPYWLSAEVVTRLYHFNMAEPWIFHLVLESLVRLTGHPYTPDSIAYQPLLTGDARAEPPSRTTPLPPRPTFRQLHDYYNLEGKHVAAYADVSFETYARLLAAEPVPRAEAAKVLAVISSFTGQAHTLETLALPLLEEEDPAPLSPPVPVRVTFLESVRRSNWSGPLFTFYAGQLLEGLLVGEEPCEYPFPPKYIIAVTLHGQPWQLSVEKSKVRLHPLPPP